MTDKKPSLPGWNHTPNVPLQVSPVFRKPFRAGAVAYWFWSRWFLISERLILVGLAVLTWAFFHPSQEVAQTLSVGWIAAIYLRNLILFTIVAGGLHLWFHGYRKQGERLKFDPRPLARKAKQFTMGGQIVDNMFWSLASGVTVWTAYEVLMLWALANGWMPLVSWDSNPIWFVALFFLIPIWESFYFYWIHRFLHWPPLYKRVHSVHHRNVNVGPWSGLSMHPVEHVIFLGSVLVHFVAGAHPLHIINHLQYLTLTAASTHCGFEALVVKDKSRLALGTFHHQMHHRYFECNYGSLEVPWDKVFGSFHDGTAEANEAMKVRRKRIMGG
ncbi:sterol desaturase family protein [Thalassococcus lentus]|uniref:Sterol desaturase family protein n=1 Tax=Thalassococcus lentus TaxID=1210524 RepID=A0ABT4XSB0_9RHOB|nr:sterol desaturase family protein [Thalassococcus lentus]MDA7424826.1 sterol desaturase family protein [Thalassococcus lentus]